MHRRRLAIFIVLGAAALLGLVLFANMRPSNLFRIAAPPAAPTETEPSDDETLKTTVSTTLATVSTSTLLEKPRYTGQDVFGRNWTLTAEHAGQEGSTASATYILNDVQAVWSDPSQTTPFVVSANEGRYAQTSTTLLLTGEVSASGIGFILNAPKVEADLSTRKLKASGGSHVTGNTGGPKGWDINITAPDLAADQTSSELLLTGGVKARFTPTGK